ncbi:hypothetical protein P2N43_21450 [Escherichia coli]|uniref:hypothetical protein n=1 Tax=Escherichia coli TaxID=562 RepID=UPI00201E98F6|nr:hypothetical protein [Escherichia coli]
MSQWIKTKLGEIVILNYGKALKAQDRNAGSIPVYSSGGLTGWHNKALRDPLIISPKRNHV